MELKCGVGTNRTQYLEFVMHTVAWSPALSSWLGGWMFPSTSQIRRVIVQFIPPTFGPSIWHDFSFTIRPRICSTLHNIMCTPFQEKPSTNNYAQNTMKGSEKNALQYDQQKEIVVSTKETWGPYGNLCLEANVTGCWYLWACLCLFKYSSQYAPRNDHWLRWHELRHGLDIVPSAGWNLIRCCKFRQHHYGLFMYTGCYYRQLILDHFCSSLHVITITPTSCRVVNGPVHLSSTI